jgi:hypothetical protein
MTFLNRNALLKKSSLRIEKVNLGDDDFVFVREMTASERDDYELSLLNNTTSGQPEKNMKDFRAKFCVRVICDEQGNRILKDRDIEKFSQNFSSSNMKLVFNKAKELNNILDEEIKDTEKN